MQAILFFFFTIPQHGIVPTHTVIDIFLSVISIRFLRLISVSVLSLMRVYMLCYILIIISAIMQLICSTQNIYFILHSHAIEFQQMFCHCGFKIAKSEKSIKKNNSSYFYSHLAHFRYFLNLETRVEQEICLIIFLLCVQLVVS